MPDAYEQYLVPVVFRPFAEDLAARATALHPGRVLELAAGTGALTSILLTEAPSAEVTATDLNEAMVAFGSARATGAAWRRADAQRLPFPDGGFDLAAAGFTVEDERELTLEGRAASTADLATGYLTGTPVRLAVEERGGGPTVRATVIEEMTARLGTGPAVAPMTAYVFRAASVPRRRI
ncbi:hypothetical protein AMK27_06690 [Streptomyces sp. CB02009]|nr:hypothetical protein AMK27_06690 [Streptomyces sp. CB02009]